MGLFHFRNQEHTNLWGQSPVAGPKGRELAPIPDGLPKHHLQPPILQGVSREEVGHIYQGAVSLTHRALEATKWPPRLMARKSPPGDGGSGWRGSGFVLGFRSNLGHGLRNGFLPACFRAGGSDGRPCGRCSGDSGEPFWNTLSIKAKWGPILARVHDTVSYSLGDCPSPFGVWGLSAPVGDGAKPRIDSPCLTQADLDSIS